MINKWTKKTDFLITTYGNRHYHSTYYKQRRTLKQKKSFDCINQCSNLYRLMKQSRRTFFRMNE